MIAICTALAVSVASAQTRPADGELIRLWQGDAPGSEGMTSPEVVELRNGRRSVSDIHRPSITAYLPKDGATGVGVVIAPGGGHSRLLVDNAGHNIARALNARGIAGFVLKYRLAREEGSPYTIEGHALDDAKRAIRLIRSQAGGWGLDPEKIGIMGFSAGGEVAVLAATSYDAGDPNATDAVERQSSRPAFQALVYPGSVQRLKLSSEMPPSFLVCGEDDRLDISQGLPELYVGLKKAGASAELHVYAGVGHGFGLGGSEDGPVSKWLDRFSEWLGAVGLLQQT